jgi:hypothetical protein
MHKTFECVNQNEAMAGGGLRNNDFVILTKLWPIYFPGEEFLPSVCTYMSVYVHELLNVCTCTHTYMYVRMYVVWMYVCMYG